MTDKPGTMRMSADGDIAILTTDQDDAPWFHVDADGRRSWATHQDVRDWEVRTGLLHALANKRGSRAAAELKADVAAFTAELSKKTGLDIDPEAVWASCQERIVTYPDGTPGPAHKRA